MKEILQKKLAQRVDVQRCELCGVELRANEITLCDKCFAVEHGEEDEEEDPWDYICTHEVNEKSEYGL